MSVDSHENQPDTHVPVMASEILSWLSCRPGGTYVDCTIGYGGMAALILERITPGGVYVGFDQDADAVDAVRRRFAGLRCRLELIQANFSELRAELLRVGIIEVDGVLFDLGVSSPQLDQPERGFSFVREGPLDMRMNRRGQLTAFDLVNKLSEIELANLIYNFGEERYSRRIAKAVLRARQLMPLSTTRELVAVIEKAVPASYRHGRIHCATKTFQALRIAVNRELEVLEPSLRQAVEVLVPGGRMCILSFHSLEDRIVKRTLQALARGNDPVLSILTKKPQTPSMDERRSNPRARSAKLRVAERLETERAA